MPSDVGSHRGRPLAPRLAAGAALLAVDEVMTLWADDPSLGDPLGLLHQALQILDGPSIFPAKHTAR